MITRFNNNTLPLLSGIGETTTDLKNDGISGMLRGLKHRPDGTCEGPGCSKVVPGGSVGNSVKQYFCSPRCQRREYASRHTIGECELCHGPIKGIRDKNRVVRFCNKEHEARFNDDRIFGPTGPFRGLIEEYLAVTTTYSKRTLTCVKPSLAHFFGHVFMKEKIETLEEIGPSVVTRFIAAEKARGMTSSNAVGHVSTFFKWLMAEERFDKRNPVIPSIHAQKSLPAEARPYTDKDLQLIEDQVKASGDVALMFAFEVGKECGLRVGETANIRLPDIDESSQTIFVRLPTKNKRTRTVPYHDGVAKYLAMWKEQRSPECQHDHLLHGKRLGIYDASALDARFKDLLRTCAPPADRFEYHRLRHTWATRLMNNGMDLAVLKELGGWVSWNSMQRYIRVLDATKKRQYQEAYAKLQEKKQSVEEEESIPLFDFALMAAAEEGSPSVTVG